MLARKLASAVCYIHSCGIIHRDIRGRNVMVGTTESGLEPKLGGFETSKDEVASSLVHGPTTLWHAPEREKYSTSFLTDVYYMHLAFCCTRSRSNASPRSLTFTTSAARNMALSRQSTQLYLSVASNPQV